MLQGRGLGGMDKEIPRNLPVWKTIKYSANKEIVDAYKILNALLQTALQPSEKHIQ